MPVMNLGGKKDLEPRAVSIFRFFKQLKLRPSFPSYGIEELNFKKPRDMMFRDNIKILM